MVDRDVVRDLEREGALSHRRAGGDDHEVRGLEAAGDAVEILEAAREARHLGARLVELADRLERLDECVLEEDELALGSPLAELEDELLGAGHELRRLALAVPAELRDLAAREDEAAQRRRLADDLRVVAGVGGRRHEPRELVETDAPADVVELAALLELVRQRDRVDRLVLAVELERGAVDLRVGLAVEIARVDDLGDGRDRVPRDHHRAEDRLLGFEILRRDGAGDGGRRRDGGKRHAWRFQHVVRRVSRGRSPCGYVPCEQVVFGHLQENPPSSQARRTARWGRIWPLGAGTSCAIHTAVDSV